jgi:excisionase family DNA binding protein
MQKNSNEFQNPFEILNDRLNEIQKLLFELTEKKELALQPITQPEKLLTQKELAEYLGVSQVTIWARAKEGSINSYKFGKLVRYKLSEILENLHKIERRKK